MNDGIKKFEELLKTDEAFQVNSKIILKDLQTIRRWMKRGGMGCCVGVGSQAT